MDAISSTSAHFSDNESDFGSLRSGDFDHTNRRQIPLQQRVFQPNRSLCSRMVVALCDWLMRLVYHSACFINRNAMDESQPLRQKFDEIVQMSQYPDKGIRRSDQRGVICGNVGSASYFSALLMQRHGLARVTRIGSSERYVVRFSQWGGDWALGNFEDLLGHIHVYYQLMKVFSEVVTYAACEGITRQTRNLEQTFQSLELESSEDEEHSAKEETYKSFKTLRSERAKLVGNMFMSSLQTYECEDGKRMVAQEKFNEALQDLERSGTRGIDFFLLASARLNFWLSILYRLDGRTEFDPVSIASGIDDQWNLQPDDEIFPVPEYIRQAVDPITRLEPDELNNMGRRLQASVPLIIALLCERSGHPHTRRERVPDAKTALEIQNAIRLFNHLGLAPDLSSVPHNSHSEPGACASL